METSKEAPKAPGKEPPAPATAPSAAAAAAAADGTADEPMVTKLTPSSLATAPSGDAAAPASAPGTAGDAEAPAPKKRASTQQRGFKLVLLGDASVGKSSIIMRFLQNKFSDSIATTVGAAFSAKTIQARNRQVKFEIWDTAGQERFRSLAPMYYRGASGAIVVYDQTNAQTFDRAKEWVKQVTQTSTNPDIIIALAANKMDLEEKREVPLETAQAFAESEGLLFIETSAKSGQGVASLFETIAGRLPDEPFTPVQRGLVVSSAPLVPGLPKGAGKGAPPSRRCCGGQ